jgi:hypothetical protein
VAAAQWALALLVTGASTAVQHGVVVAMPDDWTVDGVRTQQFATGLRAAGQAGALRVVTLDDWFAAVPFMPFGEAGLVRRLAPIDVGTPTVTGDELAAVDAAARSYALIAGGDAPEVARARRNERLALARQLDAPSARAYLDTIGDDLGDLVGAVRAPDGRTLRFTDRGADVPLQLQNNSDRTLTVQVALSGTNLTFPDGATTVVELPAHDNTVVTMAVRSRCVCRSELVVSLRTPDGAYALADGRLEVTVTTLGPVSVALTAGAAGFLALWWGVHIRRGRRARRAAAAAVT